MPISLPVLFSVGWSLNPAGPVSPTAVIQVLATITNTSSEQTITIVEGVGIGEGLYAYSLGGWSGGPPGIPKGYDFQFGNGDDTTIGPWNGQIAGPLSPGESKTFVFGEYFPTLEAMPGTYSIWNQLQIFAATDERPMIGAATFGATFQVVPEPSTLSLLGLGLLPFALLRRRKT